MNARFSRRFGIMRFSVLIVFLLLLGCDQKELKGEFTFTYYNQDEGMKLVKAFEEKHPGVKINLQIYQFSYFEHGKPETDVCVIEDAFIKRAVNRPNYLEHLLEAI